MFSPRLIHPLFRLTMASWAAKYAMHSSLVQISSSLFQHFSKTNAYLKEAGLPEINWSNLPSEDEMPFD